MGCNSSDTTTKDNAIQASEGPSGGKDFLREAVDFVMGKEGIVQDDLSMNLELSISCQNLINVDVGSLTDAACVLYLKQKDGNWHKLGETEIITDNLNPNFVKSILVQYLFEERQHLKLEVYDIDNFQSGVVISTQNLIGSIHFFVHELVRDKKQTICKPIVGAGKYIQKTNLGQITIVAEEKKRGSKNIFEFQFEGRGFGNAPHIFYRLYRNKEIDGDQYIPVFESETCKFNNTKGIYPFKKHEIWAYTLIRDNFDRMVKISTFEWKRSGKHILLGSTTFMISNVLQDKEDIILKNSTHGKLLTGHLKISKIEFHEKYSFLDYVFTGLEMSLIIAVDFTLSNGHPREPSSLHYFDFNTNQYLKAITSVGSILENYDTYKEIPVLGFGAKIPYLTPNRASHCFALNGNIFAPQVYGMEGVMTSYKNCIGKVELSGPTRFQGILANVCDMVEFELRQNKKKYYILLLITDGIINDFQETVDQIVRASSLPLSIIIVGVGDDEFTEMDELDADEVPLFSQKYQKQMERDIVQFVRFKEVCANGEELARETLDEVPRQLTSFMDSQGLKPQDLGIALRSFPARSLTSEPDYYTIMKQAFKEQLFAMSYTDIQVETILGVGLPEASLDMFCAHANNPHYFNPLA